MPTGTTSKRSRSRLASTLPAETHEIACSPLRPPNTTATRTRPAMVCEGRGSRRPVTHRSRRAGAHAPQRGRHDQLTERARQEIALVVVEVGEQLAVEAGGHLADGP